MVLGLTSLIAAPVVRQAEPTWSAEATLELSPVDDDTDVELRPDVAGLLGTARILAELLGGDEVRAQVREAGGLAEYQVTSTREAPVVSVEASGFDPEAVVTTAREVLERVPERLARALDGPAPIVADARSDVLSKPTFAREIRVPDGARREYRAEGSALLLAPVESGGPAAEAVDLQAQVVTRAAQRDGMLQDAVVDSADAVIEVFKEPEVPLLRVVASGPEPQVLRLRDEAVARVTALSEGSGTADTTAGGTAPWRLEVIASTGPQRRGPDARVPIALRFGLVGALVAVGLALVVDVGFARPARNQLGPPAEATGPADEPRSPVSESRSWTARKFGSDGR